MFALQLENLTYILLLELMASHLPSSVHLEVDINLLLGHLEDLRRDGLLLSRQRNDNNLRIYEMLCLPYTGKFNILFF